MKQLLCHILILLLVVQANMRWLLTTAYHVNKTYVAQNLCENRKQGDLKCEGKCFLKKQTKKAEERQQKEKQGKEKYEAYSSNETLLPEMIMVFLPQTKRDVFEEHSGNSQANRIFQPPRLVCFTI